jgi:hypothetical protein
MHLGRQLAERKVILRRNAKRIRHAIEESEHRSDVNGLCDLVFRPSRIPQFLHILHRRMRGGIRDDLDIAQQAALRRRQASLFELALKNRRDAFIGSSLDPQEEGVAVQSIRAAVEVGDVARNHLLVPPRQVSLGKMNRVRKLDYLTEKVWPRAEALDDAGNLFAPRGGAPEIVRGGDVGGRRGVFRDANFCGVFSVQRFYLLGQVEGSPDFLISHLYLAHYVETFLSRERTTGVQIFH